ncbi:helix-turn-helix domain-containing protein [Gemmatimonadota bacterium]
MKKSEMLNTKEAARKLGISADRLRHWCRDGVGPTFWKGEGESGHYRFPSRGINAWLNEKYQSSRLPAAQPDKKVEVGVSDGPRRQTLCLRMQDDAGNGYNVEFEGEWIINLDEEMRASEPDSDLGICFAAAISKGKRVALYTWHMNDLYSPQFDWYEDIDEMEEEIPRSIIDAIKIRTTDNHIVKLDL